MKRSGTTPQQAVFLSPAKVNLFLRVLSKRPDGFHELYSLMQPVSLYDELRFTVSNGSGIGVRAGTSTVPDGKENLAYRAAELLLNTVKTSRKIEIEIKKRIPVGAGLGGGSSNAATTLMALNSMLGAGLTDDELKALGALLGSDVPFFIMKGPALASGRGEVLERVTLPGLFYVLINPGFHVSTAWVYANLDLTKKAENNILPYSEKGFAGCTGIRRYLVNDLEKVTLARFPEIKRLKEMLAGTGAIGSLMSGSGPTVFGVYSSLDGAKEAFEALKGEVPEASSIFLAEGL